MSEETDWTLDAVHERLEACDVVLESLRMADEPSQWTLHVPEPFLLLLDEALSERLGPLRVPKALVRRLKRLDTALERREVERVVRSLRKRLDELETIAEPSDDSGRPRGLSVVGQDKVYAVASETTAVTVPPRIKHPFAERWVAFATRGDAPRRRAQAAKALAGLALVLKAANDRPEVDGSLDLMRVGLSADAAARMLAGPLGETGLLRVMQSNASLLADRADMPDVARTALRVAATLQLVLSDIV